MYLSGSVGYSFLSLVRGNKQHNVLILSDIHDGVEYCKQDSIMIAKLLKLFASSNTVLLEEAIRENTQLLSLWPNSVHTTQLRELNKNNMDIIPIDIRSALIPFSWELVKIQEHLGEITLIDYIKPLDDFFNRKSSFYKKYIEAPYNLMKNNNKFKMSLERHFIALKDLFEKYKNDNLNIINTTITTLNNNKPIILEQINNLISMIMEWYCILLVHNSENNIILHVGLAHSTRLIDILTQVYRYINNSNSGLTRLTNDIINDSHNSCIMIPSDVLNRFMPKYGFV